MQKAQIGGSDSQNFENCFFFVVVVVVLVYRANRLFYIDKTDSFRKVRNEIPR